MRALPHCARSLTHLVRSLPRLPAPSPGRPGAALRGSLLGDALPGGFPAHSQSTWRAPVATSIARGRTGAAPDGE